MLACVVCSVVLRCLCSRQQRGPAQMREQRVRQRSFHPAPLAAAVLSLRQIIIISVAASPHSAPSQHGAAQQTSSTSWQDPQTFTTLRVSLLCCHDEALLLDYLTPFLFRASSFLIFCVFRPACNRDFLLLSKRCIHLLCTQAAAN